MKMPVPWLLLRGQRHAWVGVAAWCCLLAGLLAWAPAPLAAVAGSPALLPGIPVVAGFLVLHLAARRRPDLPGNGALGPGDLFLLAFLSEALHLLCLPGMPEWMGRHPEAKAAVFLLLGRWLGAAALYLDRDRRHGRRAVAVAAASLLMVAAVALAEAEPRLFWRDDGPSPLLQWLGYVPPLVVVLVLGGVRQPWPAAALLTLLAGEWCLVRSPTEEGAWLLGQLLRGTACFLYYRSWLAADGAALQERLHLAQARAVAGREELDAILEAAPDGVLLVDAAGNIESANATLGAMLGHPSGFLEGRPAEILVPERYRSGHRRRLDAYLSSLAAGRAKPVRRMLPARCRDGSERPVEVAVHALVRGGRSGLLVVVRDAGERETLARRAGLAEGRLAGFLDNSADWVWETDAAGALTYSNPRIADILGYRPEEVLGRSLTAFMAEGDARQLGSQLREILVRQEPLRHLEHANRSRSGARVEMETSAAPFFGEDGRCLGYRGVSRDVSRIRQLQLRLERRERAFEEAFEGFPAGMALVDGRGRLRRVNPRLGQWLGYLGEDLSGASLASLFAGDGRFQAEDEILALAEQRGPLYAADVRLQRRDGAARWLRVAATSLGQGCGEAGEWLLTASDLTAEREARGRSERLLAIIERVGELVLVADGAGRLLYLNPHGRTLLGFGAGEDAGGRVLTDLLVPEAAQTFVSTALPEAERKGLWEGQIAWRCGGEAVDTRLTLMGHRDGDGVAYWTIVGRDDRERKRMEARLRHQAHHDAMTGLPNRLQLRERLPKAIARARREHRLLAVVSVDLDNFKRINDSMGQDYGDRVLVAVAERLRRQTGAEDLLTRQGGDEFILLLAGLSTLSEVVDRVDAIVRQLGEVLPVGGREIYVTASLGISVFPFDHDGGEELLRKADVAMYRAKEQGRNGYCFYTADLDRRADLDLQLEGDLRRALGREEFLLHYQPKVSLFAGEVTGFEALVRWRHPQRGMVPPGDFVPVAERSMLIAHLGQWVVREACRQVVVWRRAGHRTVPVAVNVSAYQFECTDVPGMIGRALDEFGLAGDALEVEITEGVLMRDLRATSAALARIRALGVHIAVDDFGTGYSSLGYLKHFPVDVLKIDRSFVADVPGDEDGSAIVRAIVSMAHNLGIRVVAEGVETREQLAFLRECGCDLVQGYLFGRPAAAEQAILLASDAVAPIRF